MAGGHVWPGACRVVFVVFIIDICWYILLHPLQMCFVNKNAFQ